MSQSSLQRPTLMVCLQCGSTLRDDNGQKLPNPEAIKLAETLKTGLEGRGVDVQLVRCFSLCATPIAWGLRAENGHAYTFAPAGNVEEMVEMATKWQEQGGLVKKADMPDSVRKALKSRIPPLA